MTKFSSLENDLLKRIDTQEESIPIFFRKAHGLKWFPELAKRGFFAPQNNPRPAAEIDQGHVFVPYWQILDYLEKTSQELNESEDDKYPQEFLDILVSSTNFASEEKFSNYRTWGKFAQVLLNIPNEYMSIDDLDIVDYWLDDPFDTALVSKIIGLDWLPELLKKSDNHSHSLAIKLVSLIFKVTFNPKATSPLDLQAVQLRVKAYQCRKIIDSVASPLGSALGAKILPLLELQIQSVIDHFNCDESSVIWRPAIEEHEQNRVYDQPIDLLIDLYRDTLNAFIDNNADDGVKYVCNLLKNKLTFLKRVAIQAIDVGFQTCSVLFCTLLEPSFWKTHYFKHELWTLLNHHYNSIDEEKRMLVLNSIESIDSDTSETNVQTIAYRKAEWLAAIRMYGDKEESLYRDFVRTARVEPEHPSFEAYIRVGQVAPESPITMKHLGAMNMSQLVKYLANYKEDRSDFFVSPIEGLFETFRKYIKASPLTFSREISLFELVDVSFIFQIFKAYRELWVEKTTLPWTEIWEHLLTFCQQLVTNDKILES